MKKQITYTKEEILKAIEYGARLVDISFWDEAGDVWKKKQVNKFLKSIKRKTK